MLHVHDTIVRKDIAIITENKKCHSHVTNAPKGIGQALDTFEES